MGRRRRSGKPINGWVILDKPVDMTSTAAVGAVRRISMLKRQDTLARWTPWPQVCCRSRSVRRRKRFRMLSILKSAINFCCAGRCDEHG